MGSWSADEHSRSEPALTNLKSSKTTMKPVEVTQSIVATTSGTNANVSKLSGDESVTRSSAADDDIEEEIASISEHISFDDSNVESESASGQINAINLKKRQLFDIGNANDDEDDDLDGPLFKMDDTLLSGGHIAQHFRVSDQSEHSDSEHIDDSLDDNAVSGSKSQTLHSEHSRINSQSAVETSKNSRNVDSAEQQKQQQQLNQQQQQRPSSQSSTKLDASNAENGGAKGGILEEGVILINNDQVSLNTLKNLQVHHQSAPMPQPISTQTSTITQNTTNDISDIMADDDDELSLSHLVQEKAQIRRNKSRSMEHEARKPADLGQTCRSLNSSFRVDEDDSETMHSDRSKDSSSYEEDHSIEEVAVSNASIDASRNEISASNHTVLTENFSNLSALDSNIDINNESQMNRILADTINNLPRDVFDGSQEPLDSLDVTESEINKILADTLESIPDTVFECHQEPLDSLDNQEAHAIVKKTIENLPNEMFERHQEPIDSLEYMSDGILELKERILERSEATKIDDLRSRLTDSYAFEVSEDDDQPELLQPPVVVVVKQMEKVDYSKEALEDISEESISSLEPQPSPTNAKFELGAEIPKTIQEQYVPIFDTKDVRNVFVDKDASVEEANANSFDSVVSLNMLQAFENKIRELEAIVATKDVCLTALNMQLESVYRRDSLKDMPAALDSCSLATSSTEYRTYQEDYANHRVISSLSL